MSKNLHVMKCDRLFDKYFHENIHNSVKNVCKKINLNCFVLGPIFTEHEFQVS